MAKTNRKESRKIYEGYKKRQRLWNTIFIVFFAVIGIGSAVLNGTMELDPQIVIGKYEFTWFHLVILAVLVVLLGFGIVALKRDSSEEQQEIYRQEREEAIRLRQEVMAERKQEMQDAYNAMKRRRAERQQADREPLFFLVVFHGQTSLQEKFLFRPYIITDMQEKCNQKPGAPVGTPGLASKDELHEQHIAHGAGGDAQQCVAPPPVQTRRHADGDDLRHPRPGRCELHPAQAVDQQRDHDGHWQDLAEVLHDLRHGAVAEQQPRQAPWAPVSRRSSPPRPR